MKDSFDTHQSVIEEFQFTDTENSIFFYFLASSMDSDRLCLVILAAIGAAGMLKYGESDEEGWFISDRRFKKKYGFSFRIGARAYSRAELEDWFLNNVDDDAWDKLICG